jgi:hypothetical protein
MNQPCQLEAGMSGDARTRLAQHDAVLARQAAEDRDAAMQ